VTECVPSASSKQTKEQALLAVDGPSVDVGAAEEV